MFTSLVSMESDTPGIGLGVHFLYVKNEYGHGKFQVQSDLHLRMTWALGHLTISLVKQQLPATPDVLQLSSAAVPR